MASAALEKFEFSNDYGASWFNLNDWANFRSTNATLTLLKSGWGFPRIRHLSIKAPGQAGVTIQDTVYDTRTVQIGVHISSTSLNNFYEYRRTIAGLLKYNGSDEGLLRYTFPDGTQREIVCRFVGGLDLDSSNEVNLGRGIRDVLRFFCPNPFWRNPVIESKTFDINVASGSSYPTSYPRIYTSSDLFSSGTTDNSGDVAAPVIITVTGPGVDPGIVNVSTGHRIDIARTLGDGEQIIIDTSFGVRSVTFFDGVSSSNIYNEFTGTLWQLEPGANTITVEFTDSTAASSVVVEHYDLYLVA